MRLTDFIGTVSRFGDLTHTEKIQMLAWYLHTFGGVERFDAAKLRACYQELHLSSPDFSTYLKRMSERKDLLKDSRGYRLEGNIRRQLDSRFNANTTAVAVSKILSDLPSLVPSVAEKSFLNEALACYRVRAYRASIVMVWNLAYSHLTTWIQADSQRLSEFNSKIEVRLPKKKGFVIRTPEDFEELKEFEVIEICNTAGLLSKNVIKLLQEKLARRNAAAHPSSVVLTQHQADDAISDLVANVVLRLTM
ncbi:hypothetical protein [Longimicrobium sp.]|jgi:hypothetical protein|uniref:hypothetical protein n=1 Tax=Longimicrobium sp. TaxID=2029185 RepID=UPI002F94800F